MKKSKRCAETLWYEIINPEEVFSPGLLIYPERIKSNILRMIKIAGSAERLRPHVKSHKMAEIIKLQIDLGINKFKTSTISETEMVARSGGKDILLAIQPVGPNIDRFFNLKKEFRDTRFSCIVDSEEIINKLSGMATCTGMETHVWLDINSGMNRTGVAPGESASRLIQKIITIPMLKLEGLHVYDGHIKEKDFSLREKLYNDSFKPVMEFVEKLKTAGIRDLNIVAGGTPTFPFHAMRQDVDCSPGTTLLWGLWIQSFFY